MLQIMSRRRRNRPDSSLRLPMLALAGVLVGGGAGWVAIMPAPEPASLVAEVGAQADQGMALLKPEPRPFRRFPGCNDARAAGYVNITSDEPSYRPEWDGDGDGIACEPHR